MKKIILTMTILVLITGVLFTGCGVLVRAEGENVTGSGNPETRQFDISDFTKVEIGSAFRYEIIQSDTYSVLITADDNLFDDIRVTKKGQTLTIDLRPFFHFRSATLEATITMPRLTGLESTGATRGIITGFNSGDNLDLDVTGASSVDFVTIITGDVKGNISGASKVKGDVTAGNIDLGVSGASTVEGSLTAQKAEYDLSGSSRIKLEGSANDIVIDASGASRIQLGEFSVTNADISMSGASTCRIDVSGKLDIDLSGASRLDYTGQPVLGSISLSGGSQIEGENGDN